MLVPEPPAVPEQPDLVEEIIPLRDGELSLLRPRSSEALIDEQAFAQDERMPYWAELWPSSIALARRCSGRTLRAARVVELGCGLGLPSLVAARAGGRVLATDWAPEALDLLACNAARNAIELDTLPVAWDHPDELLARGPIDLVLASDVLYERRNVTSLLELLPRLGAEVWLADPGRAFTPDFLQGAAESFAIASSRRDGAHVHVLTPRTVHAGAQSPQTHDAAPTHDHT